MKAAQLLCLLLLSTTVIPSAGLAQQPRVRRSGERGQRVDPRSANQTFQLLGFTITTGDDDLRGDSVAKMHLTFRTIQVTTARCMALVLRARPQT